MKRGFKYFVILIVFLLTCYTILWYGILGKVASVINRKHGNSYINLHKVMKEAYFIKFSDIAPTGFPFQLAFKVNNFEEEGASSKVGYPPILVGYDLLKQRFFISFKGETVALYKPVQAKFGSRILVDDYNIYINTDLNLSVIFRLFKFEIVNFIKNLEYDIGRMRVFDLVDEAKIYEQEYDKLIITVQKPTYYKSFGEFVTNIPKQINIAASNKVIMAPGVEKKIIPTSLLFGIKIPVVLQAEHKVQLKTAANNMENIFGDIEIKVNSSVKGNKINNVTLDLLYNHNFADENKNFALRLKSEFELKEGIVNSAFDLAKYLAEILRTNPIGRKVGQHLDYIIHNRDKFVLEQVENKKYNINCDYNVIVHSNKKLSINIDNMDIFAGNVGLKLKGQHFLENANFPNNPEAWKQNKFILNGNLVLYQYQKLINFILPNVFLLNKYSNFNEEQIDFRIVVLSDFLKTISDHPSTNSSDLSFKYDIDSQDITKSKIGSSDLEKIKQLYNFAFYRQLVSKIGNSDNIDLRIEQLVPSLTEQQKSNIRQLMTNPYKVENNIWEELINN